MEIKVELFPEAKDLIETLADLRILNGTIMLDTNILDGLEEGQKREIEEELKILLKWFGRRRAPWP